MAQATYVLLHNLLAMLEGGLAKLRRDLRSRVVHELPVRAKHIAARPALLLLLLLLIWVASAAVALLLRLRRARWRRW